MGSQVARLLWEQEAGGSNPSAPTTAKPGRPGQDSRVHDGDHCESFDHLTHTTLPNSLDFFALWVTLRESAAGE
jgi:hypothetical protein